MLIKYNKVISSLRMLLGRAVASGAASQSSLTEHENMAVAQ